MRDTDDRHLLKSAESISDASCIGRYMALNIEHIFNNVQLSSTNCEKGRIEQRFTLARILFSNNWEHRINLSANMVHMIDTQGIQHDTCFFDYYADDIRVRISPNREVAYKFGIIP